MYIPRIGDCKYAKIRGQFYFLVWCQNKENIAEETARLIAQRRLIRKRQCDLFKFSTFFLKLFSFLQ